MGEGTQADLANVDMAAAWDGPEGESWATNAERYEATSVRHWRRLVDVVDIQAEHDVIDIGCGTGRSTRDVARRASEGSALGVDLSARMLERARAAAEAEGLENVAFLQADAQVHPFSQRSYDVAVSSFGGMFFSDPVAAFGNVGRALRPGGTLGMLAWRELESNEWIATIRAVLAVGRDLPAPPVGAPGPFGLADPDQVNAVLDRAGFVDIELERVDEPMYFGSDGEDAFAFVSTMGITRGLTQDLGEGDRQRAFDALRRVVDAHETDEGVLFGSGGWLITARR